MNYDRVRACIRAAIPLKLILIDIPIKLIDEHYPPLIERDITKVLADTFDPIPWYKFEN